MLRELGQIDGREAIEQRGISSNWSSGPCTRYRSIRWLTFSLSMLLRFEAMLERVAAESGSPLPTRVIDNEESSGCRGTISV